MVMTMTMLTLGVIQIIARRMLHKNQILTSNKLKEAAIKMSLMIFKRVKMVDWIRLYTNLAVVLNLHLRTASIIVRLVKQTQFS